MHPFLRLLGWCLVVASLTGILWPERPDDLEPASMEVHPEQAPAPRPFPPGGREAASPPPPACASWTCSDLPTLLPTR